MNFTHNGERNYGFNYVFFFCFFLGGGLIIFFLHFCEFLLSSVYSASAVLTKDLKGSDNIDKSKISIFG